MGKKQRKRRNAGWAHTKQYPHGNHPAHYRRKDGDEIEYLTFTHSKAVDMPNGQSVQTVPMFENVNKAEREENRRQGKKAPDGTSYAYPKVFEGKRSALGKEADGFGFADERDKKRAAKMFEIFPREHVGETGGKTKYRKRKKKTPRE